MHFRRFACIALALTALCALTAGSVASAAAEPGPEATAAKKKRSCKGKKGKKKASAAKKRRCRAGKKRRRHALGFTGPQIPAGDYVCSYAAGSGTNYAGTVHILAGSQYRVNEGSAGAYKYFPDTGIMQFPTGDYKSFYARYSPDSKGFDVFSAVNDGILQVGDYGWTCSLD